MGSKITSVVPLRPFVPLDGIRRLQRVADVPGRGQYQAFGGDGGTGDVADEMFKSSTGTTAHRDAGMQREPRGAGEPILGRRLFASRQRLER